MCKILVPQPGIEDWLGNQSAAGAWRLNHWAPGKARCLYMVAACTSIRCQGQPHGLSHSVRPPPQQGFLYNSEDTGGCQTATVRGGIY